MAGEPNFGMDKGSLRSLLKKAAEEPVSCAVAKGANAGAAYILVDKVKQPKALEAQLKKDFGDIKELRHGMLSVDADKIVQFQLNRPCSGLGRGLAKVLKTCGYGKLRFAFDDGSAAEALEEDAEKDGEEAPPTAAEPDAAALKGRLAGLVQQVGALQGPQRAAAVELAKSVQKHLAAGDAGQAQSELEQLAAAVKAGAEAAPASPPAGGGGPVAYAKSRLAWLAVRKKMQGDFQKLETALVDYLVDEDKGEVMGGFQERVEPVLSALDEGLADTLDAAVNETDPTKRARLVDEAKATITRYQSFVASEPVLAELDQNPFVPMAIQSTLSKTLETLAGAIR